VLVRRFFNTAGPCEPSRHYLLSPLDRLPGLRLPIERAQYFVLHAPRQSGKTTLVRALARELTDGGILALWTGLDAARIFPDVERAEAAVLRSIHTAGQQLPASARPPHPTTVDDALPGTRLQTWLAQWSRAIQPHPLVLFLDEADGLRPEPLLSVLAQLRGGYPSRVDGQFPSSIGLVGLRDLRDYVVAAKGGSSPGPTSPFNIKVESFTLANFTRDEVAALYGQHTADTGQTFEPDAVDRAAWWSRGQPYLVNALAARCVDVTVVDQREPVRAHHVDEAAEHLIRARVTHLDNLAERLREPRVARVLQAVLLGEGAETVDRRQDDFRYVLDLGLLTDTPSGLAPANPMYGEVMTRELTVNVQAAVPLPPRRWRRDDGSLDVPELLAAWRDCWRQNADVLDLAWAEGYPEAIPHLVLLAFLQRVVNGGGSVHREFALGRGAVDIVVEYAGQRHVIEVKRVAKAKVSLDSVVESGIVQLAGYLDTIGASEGWLIVFDQRSDRSWEGRLWAREVTREGKRLHLIGA
jgi:hypothetical protein